MVAPTSGEPERCLITNLLPANDFPKATFVAASTRPQGTSVTVTPSLVNNGYELVVRTCISAAVHSGSYKVSGGSMPLACVTVLDSSQIAHSVIIVHGKDPAVVELTSSKGYLKGAEGPGLILLEWTSASARTVTLALNWGNHPVPPTPTTEPSPTGWGDGAMIDHQSERREVLSEWPTITHRAYLVITLSSK